MSDRSVGIQSYLRHDAAIHLEELLVERGRNVDHVTIYR
jgi:hypothetical protein